MSCTINEQSSIKGILPCKNFSISLQLDNAASVSRFPAATLRGGFGSTLRRLVCPTTDLQCSACLLRNNCVYCYLFETTPSPDSVRLKNYKAVPHPFTLWCDQTGAVLRIELLLIGKAIQYLPYFIYTLRKLGTQGLGKEYVKFEIESVRTDAIEVFRNGSENVNMHFDNDNLHFFTGEDSDGTCTLDIYSPMLLRKDGRNVNGFDSYAFMSTLLRRITSLYVFHCDGDNFDNCKDLLDCWVSDIKADAQLKIVRNTRFSTRQQRQIDYDGFAGTVTLTGNIGRFLPLLQAGEVLAVGKNTAFGFGRYRIRGHEFNAENGEVDNG